MISLMNNINLLRTKCIGAYAPIFIEKMKDIIERQTIGLRKIPFILGRFKEVRI